MPIGGVWRPEEEDEHKEYVKLFFDEEERGDAADQQSKDKEEQGNFCESDQLTTTTSTTTATGTSATLLNPCFLHANLERARFHATLHFEQVTESSPSCAKLCFTPNTAV